MRPFLRTILLGALCLVAGCAAPPMPADDRYALDDTKIIDYSTPDHARRFKLLVSLPRNYEKRQTERFPVIYLLDADYSFAIARNALRHFTDRDQAREAIIVGIAYPDAEKDLRVYWRTRTQDYTPSVSAVTGSSAEVQKVFGGQPGLPSGAGSEFLHIVGDNILPDIDRRFRTDPTARMIVGHSYGGLFATYTMLTRPELFRDYLIVSPSYWYDTKMIFGLEHSFIATHRSLPAHVFYAVGSRENLPPPGAAMVDDLKAFDMELKAANLSGYDSTVTVFDGETHNSIVPAALTRGLRVLYDFNGETLPKPRPHMASRPATQ